MSLPIVIPSAGRAAQVLTNIAGQILYVPETEADAYLEHNDCQIITHKPTRNLAHKRQEIYERFGDVFMVDDDIEFVSRVYTEGNNRKDHLAPDEIREIIERAYEISCQADIYLFGFSRSPHPKHYIAHKPYRLVGYINACAFGIRKHDRLFFTEKTTAAESHWINLLNAYHNRKCFIDTRFHFAQEPNSTFFKAGGQASKRTLQSEKQDSMFLRQIFGESVILKRSKTDVKGVHQYQRTIKIDL
jgi:hypothetical protein